MPKQVGTRRAELQRVAIAAPLSQPLHDALATLDGFDGLVDDGTGTVALFAPDAKLPDQMTIDLAIATAAVVIATPPPAPPPVTPVEDFAAEYAAAKTDTERLDVLARQAGLVKP